MIRLCGAFGCLLAFAAGLPLALAQSAAIAPVQDFVAPAPGTYALPPIQAAASGWVLEHNWLPRRLSQYTHGALTLLSFVYTYCTDPIGCPLAYATFDTVKRRVLTDPVLRGQVRLVSLSFDPVHDTPEAMRMYGGEHARSKELPWHFLTTYSTRFLKPILDDFGQDVEIELDAQGNPTRARAHMLKVFLLDRQGQVREIYSTAFLHPEVILNDMKTLAMESIAQAQAGVAVTAMNAGRIVVAIIAAMVATVLLNGPPARAAKDGIFGGTAAFGLPPLQLPADVVPDPGRIELGRKLFFDRRLSFNGTMSCAMCHVPEEGFTSHASRTALGIEGKSLTRNAPSLLNVAWQQALFHDGRSGSLTAQAWIPLLNPDEMANPSVGHVLRRIRGLADYDRTFERVFRGAGPSQATLGAAIAAFEASLVSADSRFDRWHYGGQPAALTDDEQRGFAIFAGKGRCATCHTVGARHALLSDGKYHVTGAGMAPPAGRRFIVPLAPGVHTELSDADLAAFATSVAPDLGRFEFTRAPVDRYAFKTPSLRNVNGSAPYMHDGSLATLEDVVEFYDRGGGDAPGKSETLSALGLDAREKRALVAFLRALDGANLPALLSNSRRQALP